MPRPPATLSLLGALLGILLGAPLRGSPFLGTSRAAAQDLPGRPRPRTDSVPLESGFTPDPIRFSGQGGGERGLRSLGAECEGFVGDRPARVLELTTDFAFLRVFAVSAAPVALALRDASGQWRCGAQRLGGAVMEEGAFAPGRLEVWVGGVEQGATVGFDLAVTEFRSVGPSVGGVTTDLNIGLELEVEAGRFRDRRLRRGFLPDPREDGGTATGSIDVRSLGPECRGFVESAPSHRLTLRNDFDYFRVQLGDAAGRVSVVLRTPGGRYLCSAPDGSNPFVDQDAWPEGDYLIWVGPRQRGEESEYRICYTEIRPAEGSVHCGSDRMGEGVSRVAIDDEDDD